MPSSVNHSGNVQAEKDLYCRIPLTDLTQNRQSPREREQRYQGLKAGGKVELFLHGSRGIFNLLKIGHGG